MKYIIQPEKQYNGLKYRSRKIVAHEDLLERLSKVPEAIVYSSWRSLAEQKELVKNGKSKTLASNHRRGTAVDCINWKEIEPKMRKVGLINDISWDRNHFALGGESQAAKYPLVDSIPADIPEWKPIVVIAPKIEPEGANSVEDVSDTKIQEKPVIGDSVASDTQEMPITEETNNNLTNNTMVQIKNSFDAVTMRKILRGAIISGGGAAAIYVLQFISTGNFGDMTPLVTSLCSFAINAIYQFQRGIEI